MLGLVNLCCFHADPGLAAPRAFQLVFRDDDALIISSVGIVMVW